MKKNIFIVTAVLVVFAGCFYGAFLYFTQKASTSTSFDPRNDINTIGTNRVMLVEKEAGATEVVGSETTQQRPSDISIDFPQPNTRVESPLTVTGQAVGSWFFEASFPMVLLNANGTIIGQGSAQAQGDWMTSDLVPFKGTLTFSSNLVIMDTTGTLVLQKENPSGLPENDESFSIPVVIGK